MSQLAQTVDPLPGWRQELQVALDANTVDLHRTLITIAGWSDRVPVTQIYAKKDNKVLCCILSEDAAAVAQKRSGNERIDCNQRECIVLWPDGSVDVYNSKDMTYARPVGSVGTALASAWTELWTCHVVRWKPEPVLGPVPEPVPEPKWEGVGFQLEKARRGMDFIEQCMREELQEIIDYELKERCDPLNTLKACLQLRLNSVDVCKSTAWGMQTWTATVRADLETFTGSVGLPEYSGGADGSMPRLVDTEMNRMKDFVNKKINACVASAEGLRIKKVQEDAWTAKAHLAEMRTLLRRMQLLRVGGI
jgi:hypothetical protein